MIFLVLLLLLGSLLGEGTFVALPFVLTLLIVMQITYRSQWVMIVAFLSGIFLDVLLFRTIGVSSLFFITVLGLISVYERRFEVQSYPFLFSGLLIGASGYLIIFGSVSFLTQIVISEAMGTILFFLFVKSKTHQHDLA